MAKESHGMSSKEVDVLSGLLGALRPVDLKEEAAKDRAAALGQLSPLVRESVEAESEEPIQESSGLTKSPQASTPRTTPAALPPAVVVATVPPAQASAPVHVLTVIKEDVPERMDLTEGIVKTWVSDKVIAALNAMHVDAEHWDKIEDAVFAAAIAGKLGTGAVGAETEKAITDLVASLAEPAATKDDAGMSSMDGEPEPDMGGVPGFGDDGPTDMDEPEPEHEPTDMDEIPPQDDKPDFDAESGGEDEEDSDSDDAIMKLFGHGDMPGGEPSVSDDGDDEDEDGFGELGIEDDDDGLDDIESDEDDGKPAKSEKKPEKDEKPDKDKEKDDKPEKKSKDKKEALIVHEAFGLRWSETSVDEGIVVREQFFDTHDARAWFIRQLMESPDFREIIDYPEDAADDASNVPSTIEPEFEMPDNLDDRGGDSSKHWEGLQESKLSEISSDDYVNYKLLALVSNDESGTRPIGNTIQILASYGFSKEAIDHSMRKLVTDGLLSREKGTSLVVTQKGRDRMQELAESAKSLPLVEVQLKPGMAVIYHTKPGLEFGSGTDHKATDRRYLSPLALPAGLAEAVLYGLLDPREAIVKLADAAIDAKINDSLRDMGFKGVTK